MCRYFPKRFAKAALQLASLEAGAMGVDLSTKLLGGSATSNESK
jgi:hypothetical protein